MVEPRMIFPHPEAIGRMLAIPGLTAAPTMFVQQEGPESACGPEQAGAILMLQTSFVTEEGARAFWDAAAEMMEQLAVAPGFIRRYTFPESRSGTLLAFWRTIEDAKRFAASPEHRAAVKKLYAGRWQYSHFTALWEIAINHGRTIFCTECPAVTPIGDGVCSGCGTPLIDTYRREPAAATT